LADGFRKIRVKDLTPYSPTLAPSRSHHAFRLSALSMTALMALCSLLALASYLLLARPAERVAVST
jgi:hypothetical protein